MTSLTEVSCTSFLMHAASQAYIKYIVLIIIIVVSYIFSVSIKGHRIYLTWIFIYSHVRNDYKYICHVTYFENAL
jgi:hypothetical protein